MKIAYADPPYPGCARLYKNHPDYAGEVDHLTLCRTLAKYDGWVLHTSSPSLHFVESCVREAMPGVEYRVMPWVKPFAAFKRNVPVAYAWEPVLIKPVRKPVVSGRIVMRDWVSHSIMMKKGLTGAKPPDVCRWAFEMIGAEPDDKFTDMFPGTGIVLDTWNAWCSEVAVA